jgi:two-component system, chemotaxis family, protein-glutamate methylesterase/glutaminase
MQSAAPSKIDVLVVDDSAVIRQLMTSLLATDRAFQVATASDPLVAMARMRRSRPHVILLDLEMPRMDGLTFLKRIMAEDPLPIVVCSGFAEPGTRLALRALGAGAVEVALKPRLFPDGRVEDNGLLDIVRAAAQARVRVPAPSLPTPGRSSMAAAPRPSLPKTPLPSAAGPRATDMLVAIGASTGGTEALREVLGGMPPDAPGIVVVQHMPPGFTAAFAEHLDAHCRIEVREAKHGDRVQPGLALIAPGNRHVLVQRRGSHLLVELSDAAPVCRHRPSADVLFRSVAAAVGPRAVGVILTGMGSDGANGLREMRLGGAHTIAQDESTSVVFGMPKEAFERGAVDTVLPLPRICGAILARGKGSVLATGG